MRAGGSLIGQAGVLGRSDPEKALAVAATAFTTRAKAGGGFPPIFRARAEGVKKEAELRLGAEAPRIWAEGTRLGTDEAIALAFSGLVAEGLSNKAIASRLQLSVRTVESHVRHALTKLALENRTQLATWARERIQ